jgi:hypothetical protein
MTDQNSDFGIRTPRRLSARLAAVPIVKQFLIETRCDPLAPWFLEDVPRGQGRPFILIYGKLRSSGVILRTAFIVLRSWWNHPMEPEIVSNGSRLISNSLGGVSKPALWMASVGIAGVVGSEIATSSSSITSSEHLVIWIYVAFGVALCVAAYHWWKLLDRLRRVLVTWVAESRAKSNLDRRADDIALFGYTFGNNFRGQLKIRGVKFLSILTFSAVMYFSYRNGQR